jgi:hypothetical protein
MSAWRTLSRSSCSGIARKFVWVVTDGIPASWSASVPTDRAERHVAARNDQGLAQAPNRTLVITT